MNLLRHFQSPTPDQLLGGRYKLIGSLGAGGFGQTFLAEDIHLPGHPRCVIKQLKPQFSSVQGLQTAKRLFDTEAKVLYKLGNHDQIPRLLAHFEQNQQFYLAQELIIGDPLDTELGNDRQWTEPQVVALLVDLLSTLAFVHQKGVIHRDIKPQNLIRRRCDRKIVLIDFGAVKQASVQLADPNSAPTRTISIGTRGYMPNEQIAGNPRFSSDIYAVGKIAIQALTGVAPRYLQEDPKTGEVQWQHLVPQVNPELADLLEKMVHLDFRTRFSTAIEVLAALQQLAIIPTIDFNSPVAASSNAEVSQPMLTTQPWTEEPAATAYSAPQSENSQEEPMPNQVPSSESGSQSATLPLLPPNPQPNQGSEPQRRGTAETGTIHKEGRNPLKWLLPLGGLLVVGLLMTVKFPNASPPEVQPQSSPVSASPAASPTPTPSAMPDRTQETAQQTAQQTAALLAQAKQQQASKQFQKALELYDRAIALNTQSAEAQWGRCYSLNRLQQAGEAIQACDAALALNPNYAEALWSKGYALDLQQQHQQALALYDRAIALKPNYAEAWSNKGSALYRLDRVEEALAALDKATQLNANLAEAWNNRGAVLWSLQQYDAAVASIDRALQIEPDYADARNLRGQMRQKLGK